MKKICFLLLCGLMACTGTEKNGYVLYKAAEKGNTQLVQRLINEGHDVNYVCINPCTGWTPVMIAAAEGHPDTVKLLLENGADPKKQNRMGLSALHFAVRYKFHDIVDMLLQYGADPLVISRPETDSPNSPLADALVKALDDEEYYKLLKKLIYHTKQVNFEFWDYTPLMQAVRKNDVEFAKYLLENGADPYYIKTVNKDNVALFVEIDEMPASPQMKDLFHPYLQAKKAEMKLLEEQALPNLERLRKAADEFAHKNGGLPTYSGFFQQVEIPDGTWRSPSQNVTPAFVYNSECDLNGCRISATRLEKNTSQPLYKISLIQPSAKKPWQARVDAQTFFAKAVCMILINIPRSEQQFPVIINYATAHGDVSMGRVNILQS